VCEQVTNGKDKCGYWFAERLRRLNRICFPTLGLSGTGKTVWLAMTYRELLKAKDYGGSIRFDRERDDGTKYFDGVVNALVYSKSFPSPTQQPLPPLNFDFTSNDCLGTSHDLLTLLDLPGRVTEWDKADESFQRRRALKADGFVFFIDPTRAGENQATSLNDFIAELSQVEFGQRGRLLHTPIALCVSKIEMMVNMPYASDSRRSRVERFYQDLTAIGWDEANPNLSAIQERHRLVTELQKTIWPAWKIRHSIGDPSGAHHMFFPLSSIGLDEPGQQDLKKRNVRPRGIIEPLLWLLHMNGYQVFSHGMRHAFSREPVQHGAPQSVIVVPPPTNPGGQEPGVDR
jgi:hypothetical protein